MQQDKSSAQVQKCGLYIHIPFCIRKCLYCSFFSVPARDDIFNRYCDALTKHLKQLARDNHSNPLKVQTIFFGGGTPSILPVELLSELLFICRGCFPCSDNLEISMEANPATVNRDDLDVLFQAGFNRLSIGVQSFDNEDLVNLGRSHTVQDAKNVFMMARRTGFANISLDLMYGLHNQTISDWRKTLKTALELEPDHLSIYELTIEEGTNYANRLSQGVLHLPDEDEVLSMMQATLEETSKRGFQRYEISNYAQKGKECRHNINYWQNAEYIGVGAGAVSCLSGQRSTLISDIDEYCRIIEAGNSPVTESEALDPEARFRETVIMGLRMTKGISISGLEKRFSLNVIKYYDETLQKLLKDNLLEIADDYLKLSEQGLRLANMVMSELV